MPAKPIASNRRTPNNGGDPTMYVYRFELTNGGAFEIIAPDLNRATSDCIQLATRIPGSPAILRSAHTADGMVKPL